MVAKVHNEGECPVRVFCPLNVRGMFSFGTITVNVLLWFGMTFLWTCRHDVGVKRESSHAPKEGCYYLTKFCLMRQVVELSWGMELRQKQKLRFEIRLMSPISKAQLATTSTLTSTSHNFLIQKLEISSWGLNWGSSWATSCPQVEGLWNTLMGPASFGVPSTLTTGIGWVTFLVLSFCSLT